MRTEDTTNDDLTNPGAANDFFTRRTFPPFDPDASGFSAANALWLIELSRLVYRRSVEEGVSDNRQRVSFLSEAGLTQIKFINGADKTVDTQGMLVQAIKGPPWAALVFRGTERHPKDVITDLMTLTTPLADNGLRVHDGFEHALEIVWKEQVAPTLDELAKAGIPLYFTGHSLGAALATLAALRHPPRAVYTFGSPLVGNPHLAEALKNVKIFRVIDDQDEVTRVPPRFFGYLHVGEEHRLTETPRPPFPLFGKKIFSDHAPVNYIDRLI